MAFSNLNHVQKYFGGRSKKSSENECAEIENHSAIWAYHSNSQSELISIIDSTPRLDWSTIRSAKVALWCREVKLIRDLIEKLARMEFQNTKDPMRVAIWFCILKKEKVLAGLFKSVKNAKMADFFGHNFLEARWRQAALKNGYALLGHRRYYDAIAFFLIGGSLKDAIDIAQNRLQDFQLALLIAILYSGQEMRMDLILEIATSQSDPFVYSIYHWTKGDYSKAVNVFLEDTKVDDSIIFNFYRFISRHPLYLKALSLNPGIGGQSVGSAGLLRDENELYLSAATEYIIKGSPLAALFVLQDGVLFLKNNSKATPSVKKEEPEEVDDWSKPVEIAEETLELDWSDSDQSEKEDEISIPMDTIQKDPIGDIEMNDEELFGSDTPPVVKFLQLMAAKMLALESFSYKKCPKMPSEVKSLIASVGNFLEDDFILNLMPEIGKIEIRNFWVRFLKHQSWSRQSPYHTALHLLTSATTDDSLSIEWTESDWSIPPLFKMLNEQQFFIQNDIDQLKCINDRLVTLYSQIDDVIGDSLSNKSNCALITKQISSLLFNGYTFFSRLIHQSDPSIDFKSTSVLTNQNHFWIDRKETKFIIEFTAVVITGLSILAIMSHDQIIGLKTLTRILVTDYNKAGFSLVDTKTILIGLF